MNRRFATWDGIAPWEGSECCFGCTNGCLGIDVRGQHCCGASCQEAVDPEPVPVQRIDALETTRWVTPQGCRPDMSLPTISRSGFIADEPLPLLSFNGAACP